MWKTQNSHNMLKTIQLAAFISLRVASFAAEFLPVNDALRFLRTNEGGATLHTLAIRSWFIRTDWHSTLHSSSCVLLVGLHPTTCHLQYGTSDWGGLDAAHFILPVHRGFFFFSFLTKLWEQQISATSGQNHRLHYLKCHRILTLRTVTQQIFRSQRVVRITDIVQRWKNW